MMVRISRVMVSLICLSSLMDACQSPNLNLKQLYSDLKVSSPLAPNALIEELNNKGVLAQPANNPLPQAQAALPLFEQYPGLAKLPHISLGKWPTPIVKLENAGAALGLGQLFLKNDGYDDENYTGNKPRKLEFEMGRAWAHGAKTVMTYGCVGSNHAVATSDAARRFGLKSICMLKHQENSNVVRKNLLLHLVNGTELHYYPDNNIRKIGTLHTWHDYQNTHGDYPYIIPTGGSTPLGTVGFVNAACELKKQIDAGILSEPDYIYVPCGSKATTAGLILGCKAAGLKSKIMAIAVEPEEEPSEFINGVTDLFNATNELLRNVDSAFPHFKLSPNDIEVNLKFTGPDYAVFTPEGMEARKLLKQHENITIDGTYTAKAFAALIADAREKQEKNKTVLFWDTYCGNDFKERLAGADYKKLPVCFHKYFEEDVQLLDKE